LVGVGVGHPVAKADFLYELEVNQSMCRFILKFLMICLLEDAYSLVLVVMVQMKDLIKVISIQGYLKMYWDLGSREHCPKCQLLHVSRSVGLPFGCYRPNLSAIRVIVLSTRFLCSFLCLLSKMFFVQFFVHNLAATLATLFLFLPVICSFGCLFLFFVKVSSCTRVGTIKDCV